VDKTLESSPRASSVARWRASATNFIHSGPKQCWRASWDGFPRCEFVGVHPRVVEIVHRAPGRRFVQPTPQGVQCDNGDNVGLCRS
jgi:hypothetical protein